MEGGTVSITNVSYEELKTADRFLVYVKETL